jgi:HEAT repeat protein
MFAESLKTSTDGERRAFAAMALGGAGDVTYLRLLREVASRDPHANARAAAYGGIVDMLGPAALEDLRRGAKDSNERVRASITSDAYNMLELEQPERRWPPASNAHIEEVRAFLSEMERDPAVRDSAKYMLALIAGHRR